MYMNLDKHRESLAKYCYDMSPMAISFLMAGGMALIGIILVLIFDRPKRPKSTPSEDPKEASHRVS